MTQQELNQLGKTLWDIADQLRGAMNADDFRDYMLSFLFLRYLSDNYETSAKKELGKDYPTPGEDEKRAPLAIWYENNAADVADFEKQMRLKVHYVIEPQYLWSSVAEMARTQHDDLLDTLVRIPANSASIPPRKRPPFRFDSGRCSGGKAASS